jgi:hypothetical protein
MLRLLGTNALSDGTLIQVVEDENHNRQIELVPPYGAEHPATESGGECVRIILKSPSDRRTFIEAVELAWGRLATQRPQRSGG